MAIGITASSSKTYAEMLPEGPTQVARRRQLAEPVLLFFRRVLDSALAEAKRTRHGRPTDLALKSLHWIQVPNTGLDMAVEADKMVHLLSFAGACEMLGLKERKERKRMLLEIKAAYAEAAAEDIQAYVHARMGAVLTCAGVPARSGSQYMLGLVSADEHDDVAGIDHPDPPARTKRKPARPRTRRRGAPPPSQ